MLRKNPLTPAGIEPATFRFVVQHLNHSATAVPRSSTVVFYYALQHVAAIQISHRHVCVGYTKRNVKGERESSLYSGTRDAGVAMANLDCEVFSNTHFYLVIVYTFYYILPCFFPIYFTVSH